MRLLLDENVPADLKNHLPDHDVRSTMEMGWTGLTNGALLARAEHAGFNALLTADQNLKYQQNLASRRIALVVISTNHWPTLQAGTSLIAQALDGLAAGAYLEVGLPRPTIRRRPAPGIE